MTDRLHICIMALSFGAWCHGPSHQSSGDHTRCPMRSPQADIDSGVWPTLHRSLVFDNPLGCLIWSTCSTVRWMKISCRLITRQRSSAFGREDRMEYSNWASKLEKKRGIQVTLCLSVLDRLVRIGGFMLSHLQGSHRMEKQSAGCCCGRAKRTDYFQL